MAPTATVNQPELDPKFGAGQLFVADSRLALSVLNSVRYAALRSMFGVSREQANVVTFFAVLLAADAAYETARRVVRAPLGMSGTDALLGGFAVREAAFGVTGSQSRNVRLFGPVVAGALVASLAVPGLRRAARSMRQAEREIRERRIAAYRAAMRVVGADD
jgi:hypothetical protein